LLKSEKEKMLKEFKEELREQNDEIQKLTESLQAAI